MGYPMGGFGFRPLLTLRHPVIRNSFPDTRQKIPCYCFRENPRKRLFLLRSPGTKELRSLFFYSFSLLIGVEQGKSPEGVDQKQG